MTELPEAPKLPALKPGLRLTPFGESHGRKARFLVEVDRNFYAVGGRVYHILAALGEGPATYEELQAAVERRLGETISLEALREAVERRIPRDLFSGAPARRVRSPFTFKAKLIPENVATAFSSRLTWLYAKPVVFVGLAAFAVVLGLLGPRALAYPHVALTWQNLVVLYVAILASTFFHELGHAAACRRHGVPHGEIGFAIYLLYPAFYTDVTTAWRLPPAARAVVDAGGVYFQALLLVFAGGYALYAKSGALDLFFVTTLFSMLYTLNPVFKMDGYWLLSDLSGLTNLHKQMGDMFVYTLRRALRRRGDDVLAATKAQFAILAAYVALATAYVAFVVYYLGLFLAGTFAGLPLRLSAALTGLDAARQTGSAALLPALGKVAAVAGIPLLLAVLLAFVLVRFAGAARPFARRVLA